MDHNWRDLQCWGGNLQSAVGPESANPCRMKVRPALQGRSHASKDATPEGRHEPRTFGAFHRGFVCRVEPYPPRELLPECHIVPEHSSTSVSRSDPARVVDGLRLRHLPGRREEMKDPPLLVAVGEPASSPGRMADRHDPVAGGRYGNHRSRETSGAG